ncbi:N-acetyltransferase [Candidatus Sumerlaeota bacterium]|nr:N-acetyltransferase [Candidatus Sumerlaeota bacterium]
MTDPELRRRLEEKGVFLHPQALVETDEIGRGTRVWAFAHILRGAKVGERCNLCDGVFIEAGAVLGNNVTVKNHVSIWEGVMIGDNVFLGPNCVLTNDLNPRAAVKKGPGNLIGTRIEDGATVGANATIVCGVTLHRHAFVAAGATVIRDVGVCSLVAGVPARERGHMCACGQRIEIDRPCVCGRTLTRDSAGELTLMEAR